MAMPAFFALLSHKITSSIPVMLFIYKPLCCNRQAKARLRQAGMA